MKVLQLAIQGGMSQTETEIGSALQNRLALHAEAHVLLFRHGRWGEERMTPRGRKGTKQQYA
jgi:hypothetical protein